MRPKNENAYRTTITFPVAWNVAIDQALRDLREKVNPGATLNDIYREALHQHLIRKGYLKDGDQQ